jgi:hypothetical protein
VLTDGVTTGRLQVSGWLIGENRDTPYDGSEKTENPLQERTRIRVWLLTADMRASDRFGVQLTLSIPDVTRTAVVQRPTSIFNFSETFRGTGDTSVIAWRKTVIAHWGTTFNGGVSLPTGKTELPKFRSELDDGSLVPTSRLQRGTGTYDPIFGVSMSRLVARILRPGVRVFLNAAARVPVTENSFGLRTGASTETGAGTSREVYWHQLVAIGRVSWLHRERDSFDGTPVLVGGGNWLYFSPALSLSIRDVTMQAEVKLPIYRALANRQLDSARTIQVGFIWKAF